LKTETKAETPEPYFEEGSGLLLARCLKCWEHPGSRHDDGSGPCEACNGSGWHVLAMVTNETVSSSSIEGDAG
jgi:hypothetical protein